MKLSFAIGPPTALALLGLVFFGPQATAQIDVQWRGSDPGTGNLDGDFNVAANWDHPSINGPFVPEGQFDERAVINNGGVATASSAIATQGYLTVTDGGVEITPSGEVRVSVVETVDGNMQPTGIFTTGLASFTGSGVLAIATDGIFEAETLQLGGTFQRDITSTGFTPINVTSAASLGGDLEVSFTGFTPSTTDTWTLVEAGSLGGGFDSITATGITLLPGQFLDVRSIDAGGGRVAAELFVDQLLTLSIDLLTGSATMSSTSGVGVDIDGYTVSSVGGALDASDAVWNSLTEQVGSDWRESNPSANNIGELKQTGDSSIDGTGFVLGDIYSPAAPPAFRVPAVGAEDLVFEYTASDGTVRQGNVEYTGAAVNDLLLTVDPTDGRVELSNPSGFDVEIEGYTISSENGELTPAGWTSLDDADGVGNNDGGWRESNPSANFMGELLQTGTEMVNDGFKVQLGEIYDFAGASEDLVFEFLLAGDSESLVGTVLYLEISTLTLFDANVDGTVNNDDIPDFVTALLNLGDWQTLHPGLDPLDYLDGDMNNMVNNDDIPSFVDALLNPPFVTVSSGAVPEPSTAVILGMCLVGLACHLRSHITAT
ncbi:MAG: hypothetical protein ACR2NU_02900 [Aeoliella sp.]